MIFRRFTDLCMSEALLLSQHLKFLREHLIALPASYRSFDSNRAAILYFTLSTLDVLGKLDEEIDAELRKNIIEWIYRLQLKSDSGKNFRKITWHLSFFCPEIMGFCAPPTPNFGFLDTGCSVLGGIKVNPNIENQGPSCSSKDFYISQHNLAHHWQRPYMVPHTVGFPQLLTRTLSYVRDCMAMRHAGHWPFETHSNLLKNRNLLEVFENPADGSVILWSVNELSTRKRLLEFRLHRVKDEGFDEWKILTDEDDEDQERAEITEVNRSFSSDDETSNEQQIYNPKYYRTLNVNTALLELRSWRPTGQRCRILARSEKELYLCDPENNTVLTLFQTPVHSLSFIPYMNDEIIFLDGGGLIWYGEVGENFIRVKCNYDLVSVVGSDHPRLVYAADKDNVRLVDLRVGSSDGDVLYSVPEYDDTSRNSYHFQYEDAFEKEAIHQLYSLPDTPQMVLICTSKKFVIVDERMRGSPCLEMAHSIYHGGHHITSAPPIRDIDRNGTIYPFYILQHTIYPDVQTFSLYRHSDSMTWSSLASIKRLQEPRDAAAFYREQPKYDVRIPRLAEKLLFGNGPTRAISFLNIDVNSVNQKLFLFRMMDDGSLWYEQSSIQNDQDLMEKMLWRGASKVRDVIASNTSGIKRSDNLWYRRSQKKSRIFDVEFDLDASGSLSFDINVEALQPLDTHPENNYPDPEIVRDVVDEQLFSKIVLQGYPKEAYGFRGSLGFSKPSWYKAEIHGGGDADPAKSDISTTANCFLYDSAHISQTYVALCSLLILGDDLSRVDRKAILEGVCCDQLSDGSFRGQRETESDMRFVYCAIAICYILNDFSTINMKSVLKFIQRCINFDGGIGQAPHLESHGGSTFCAIAALEMAGHLWDESVLTHKQIEKLVKWALWKQDEGFHGRANKPDDSCYAFWIGGTLKILDAYMFVDIERLRSFIYSTQDRILGGFGKFSDVVPDALHTCYSISALSLLHEPNLRIIYPPLNITRRAVEHLTNINMNQ
ncbi:Geranylgeranyl transferase type-1 subunit beta [Dirofilaria immitis]